jgi:hypothetical protein
LISVVRKRRSRILTTRMVALRVTARDLEQAAELPA